MNSTHVFKNITRILVKWPLDSSKKGRDLGECVRKIVASAFPQGESTKVHVEEWARFLQSLENIASDKYLRQHPRIHQSSATGLGVEECREIVSTDFLAHLNRDHK